MPGLSVRRSLPVFSDGAFNWWASLFDFYYIGGLEGNNLEDSTPNGYDIAITGKDFSGDYIPYTSAATFQAPDNATLKADDTDYLWFDRNGVVRNVEVSELVGYDFARTIVKYDNSTPYHIRWIGILKSGVTLTESQLDRIYEYFELSQFWSGVLDERGVIKGNRAGAQSVWPEISVAALNYTDTYVTAVEADGGEIISLKVVQSEYQRLIDTGDITKCWFSYHWKCGVKINVVDYGAGDVNMTYKMYNLSPVAGRFAESVYAYGIVFGYDARAEYTSLGVRFRVTNLDGGARCGLESPTATIPTNNNNIIKIAGIINPALTTAVPCVGKGMNEATGYIGIVPNANGKLTINFYGNAASRQISTTNVFFTAGVEAEFSAVMDFTAETIVITKNGSPFETLDIGIYNPVYPTAGINDFVGHGRTLGRNVYEGYIKQSEMFVL